MNVQQTNGTRHRIPVFAVSMLTMIAAALTAWGRVACLAWYVRRYRPQQLIYPEGERLEALRSQFRINSIEGIGPAKMIG